MTTPPEVHAASARSLIDDAHVLICCGAGGVGKTTVAATLGIEGARRGRSSIVVTIDPAKRLADTLGTSGLSNTARAVDPPRWDPDGMAVHGGRFSAAMLDARTTFDGLVHGYAASEEQAERILENRFYRNIAGALSGTQEYMAAELLHQLHETGAYDLIVVDTPPTRHALDFLDAPSHLTGLLDNRVFRFLMAPARGPSRASTTAVRALLRTIGQVVGTTVVDDVVAFFQAFEGMEQGFRDRARGVVELLAEPSTAFVLVTTPARDPLRESVSFAAHLRERGHRVELLVVNQVQRELTAVPSTELRARADALTRSTDTPASIDAVKRLARGYAALGAITEMVETEQRWTSAHAAEIAAASAVHVPRLEDDVHEFAALHEVGRHLLGERPPPWRPAPERQQPPG